MQWLISQIWIALAAASVLGILFGMAFRGLLAQNLVRRALVDRDIAKTELDQTKLELDELYAAQRRRQKESAEAVSGDENLTAELAERESRISSLSNELSAARTELEALKADQADAANHDADNTNLVEQAGAALLGASAGVAVSDGDAELKERNVWLEERVAALEAEVSAAPVVAEIPEPVEDVPNSEADEELARLRWRNRYLEGRLAYFEGEEGEEITEATEISGAEAEDLSDADIEVPDTEPSESMLERDEAIEATDQVEDGASAPFVSSVALVEEDEDQDGQDEEALQVDAPDAVEELSDKELDHSPSEVSLEDSDDFEAVIDDVAPEAEHPSEAVLKELIEIDIERVQPQQAESSDDDDDLTAISGIGPKIAELLNDLGIFTYEQIAGWTPENAAWIDQHLSFSGRVERENWVEQAEDLVSEERGAEVDA